MFAWFFSREKPLNKSLSIPDFLVTGTRLWVGTVTIFENQQTSLSYTETFDEFNREGHRAMGRLLYETLLVRWDLSVVLEEFSGTTFFPENLLH